MHRFKKNYRIFIFAVFIFSLRPEIGFSLGFGPIKLYSYLNEPLDAAIELQGAEEMDISHCMVSLASVEDFKRIELARPYFLSKLQFEVVQQNKQVILKITTEEAVKQPYLAFLVLLTWPDGRVVRDYTLLLDPAPFGGGSQRAANEQALQMLNKSDCPLTPMPFQDQAAILALQEKSTQPENKMPPTAIAEAKTTLGTPDAAVGILVDQEKPVMLKPTKNQPPLTLRPEPQRLFSERVVLLGGGLVVLIALGLTGWFLGSMVLRFKMAAEKNPNKMEDIAIGDGELKLKLALADQYIAYGDIKNAKAILNAIMAGGHGEAIKLAQRILKKINRA